MIPERVTDQPQTASPQYTVIWNDAVDLRQLGAAILTCVGIGLPAFLLSRALLSGGAVPPSLVSGYALLIGLVGCVVGAVICSRLFPPKRVLADSDDLQPALVELELMGGTAATFAQLPVEVQQEMRTLGLAP